MGHRAKRGRKILKFVWRNLWSAPFAQTEFESKDSNWILIDLFNFIHRLILETPLHFNHLLVITVESNVEYISGGVSDYVLEIVSPFYNGEMTKYSMNRWLLKKLESRQRVWPTWQQQQSLFISRASEPPFCCCRLSSSLDRVSIPGIDHSSRRYAPDWEFFNYTANHLANSGLKKYFPGVIYHN